MRNCLIAGLIVTLAPLAAQAGPRIVALGDSLTAGYGLPEDQGLVPQLSRWLANHGHPAQIVNAGVSGDTTAGGRARLAWSLAEGADAMIVALGGNDMLRGLPAEEARANLDAILTEAQSRALPVLLAGHAAPGNFGPDWQAGYNALYPELAARHNAILLPDLLAPIRALPEAVRSGAMQADGLHPSADGVARVVEALGPKVLELMERIE